MGIKYLNQFLRENCSKKSIYKFHLRDLKGKTVVVDTSIYLYKFLTDNALLENFYLFLSILTSYQIKPVFIFDGKPPAEKKELLLQRLLEKREAESEYHLLASAADSLDFSEKMENEWKMQELKRKFIRVLPEDIEQVKSLMDAYGVEHYDAPGEADQVCAHYMKTRKAWACFSDDMDMFVYDQTTHIVRNLSLLNHTAFLYNKTQILTDLEMSETDFNQIMVLSGTDYNLHSNTSLKETIRWFYEYNQYRASTATTLHEDFYTWLTKHSKYITNYNTLLNTEKLFKSEDFPILETKAEKKMDMEKIKLVMKKEGFLFLD